MCAARLPKSPQPRQVAVIGGGWAGCAAAVELAARGVEVTLYESSRTLGGRARAVRTHGKLLDNGQHIMLGAYRETLRLMHALAIRVAHLQRQAQQRGSFGAKERPVWVGSPVPVG